MITSCVFFLSFLGLFCLDLDFSSSLNCVLTGMRAICDYFETNLRHVLATEIRHCYHNHIAVTLNGGLRHICDSRTNAVRLSHESLANVSRHSRDVRVAFARHSHNVRPITLRTFITIDCLTNVVRLSREGRATVVQRSCDCRTMVLRE